VDDTPLFFNMRLEDSTVSRSCAAPRNSLGSGSLGGTIRFVLNAPTPAGLMQGEIGLSKTAHTHTTNEDISGMINLPCRIAWRCASTRRQRRCGFINQTNLYCSTLRASGVVEPTTPSNPVGLNPQIAPKRIPRTASIISVPNARISMLWKPTMNSRPTFVLFQSRPQRFPYVATNPLAYTQPIAAAKPVPPLDSKRPFRRRRIYCRLPRFRAAGTDRLTNASNSWRAPPMTSTGRLERDYDFGFATLTSSSSWAHTTTRS